jgi:hypothetical protein
MLGALIEALIELVGDFLANLLTRIGIVRLVLIILIAIIVIGLIILLIKQSFF